MFSDKVSSDSNRIHLLSAELIVATQSGDAALVKKLLQTKLFTGTSAEAASLVLGAIDPLENPILSADWTWEHNPHAAKKKRPSKRAVKTVWQRIVRSIELLLDYGAEPDTVSNDRCSVLCKIVSHKELSGIFRRLLNVGAGPNSDDGTGASTLYLAAIYGNEEYVQLLLEYGADPDKGCGDFTPLMFAAKNHQFDILRQLLNAGADINCRDSKGRSALMYALYRYGDFPFLVMNQWACDAESRQYPNESIGITRLLIESGIEYAEPDNQGFLTVDYALMASIKGVELPAELNVNNNHLQLCKTAMDGNSLKMAKLIESVEIPARIKTIALTIVAVRGFETCCKILLENKTDVNGINLYGIIPAQAAAVGLRLSILTLLVEYGLSKEGLNVALMNICMAFSPCYEVDECSFQTKRLELARYLLEHGADPNAQDEENGDLISIATSLEENSDLVKLLLGFGGSIGSRIS